ncbi:MAG: ATPase, partial [Planctomycetota bacterium]
EPRKPAPPRAALRGRDFVIPEDVQQLALPVLAHRMAVPRGAVDAAAAVLSELLHAVGAPD